LTQEPQGLQQHATQDDVEQSTLVIQEQEVVPRIADVTATHSFTLQYDATREIQQEKLPITSVHVLEKVTVTQKEPVEVTNAATTQLLLLDVMELERPTHNQGIPTAETNDVTVESDETNVDANDVTAEKVVNDMEISASTMPLDNQSDALQHPTNVHPTIVNSNDG